MANGFGSALRSLRRAPSFTGLVVLTLALGIGATTAMFSVVDAVMLNPLRVPHADRLAEISTVYGGGNKQAFAWTSVVEPLRASGLFTAVEGYRFGSAVITGEGEPTYLSAPFVTPGLLDVMGASPLQGRLLLEADRLPASASIVISERLWRGRFGGDAGIIGRRIALDDRLHTVVGVLSSRFRFPNARVDVWRPLDVAATAAPVRVQLVTLRDAALTRQQVDARLQALSDGWRDAGMFRTGRSLTTDLLLQERYGREAGGAFYLLFGAVVLVLIVACVNVTNLLLVRASLRHGELALMSALGARRSDLMRGVLTEAGLLAVGGGLAGLAAAKGLLALILAMVPPQLTVMSNAAAEFDWRALAFAAAVCSVACLMFSVLPVWRYSRVDAMDVIKQRSATAVGSGDDRWQAVLVSAQLALVLVLLAGTGLLLRSFDRLVNVDPGFDTEKLAVVTIQLPSHRYGEPGSVRAFMRDLERRVESREGLRVALSGGTPPRFGAIAMMHQPEAEGGLPVDVGDIPLPFQSVSPDYFETMGTPIVRGRAFTLDDPPDVMIVSEILARRFWGDVSPIGRRFRWEPTEAWRTVIGVSGDVKAMGPSDPMGDGMEVYLPFEPSPRGYFDLIIRTDGDHWAAMQFAKQQVWQIDDKAPIVGALSMDDRLGEAVAQPRFFLGLSAAFAVTAFLLGAVGVYGVSAYWVAYRRRELAIRVALGASREAVVSIVVGRGLRLAAIGAAAGLGLAIAGARAIESLLFATSPTDPITLVSVTLLLTALVVASCLGPALRAGAVDPMTTLRAE